MAEGDTFFFDPNGGANNHLWVVVAVAESGCAIVAVMANVTSWDARKDQTCILDAGDHPAITHKSVIFYQAMLEWDEADLGRQKAHARAPMSPSVLARILAGVHRSKFTQRKFKRLVRQPPGKVDPP